MRLTRIKGLYALKLLIGLSILGLLVHSVSVQNLKVIIFSVSPIGGVLCIVAGMATIWYQGLVLHVVASPFAKIPTSRLFAFTFIGRFFSLFLPTSIGGDLIKGFYLLPYFHKPSLAYACMAAHRAIGGLSTIAIALLSCMIFLPADQKQPILALFAILIIISITFTVIWTKYGMHVERSLVRRRSKGADSKLLKHLYSFVAALSAYRSKRKAVFVSFILSSFATLFVAGVYQLIAYSLQLPLDYWQALVASSATMVAVLVPITPGSIGVSEGAFVVMAGAVGVPQEHSLSIAIAARVLGYICTIPGGILYMLMPMRTDKD